MARQFLWLLFDVALGVLVAGLLAPVAVTLLPNHLRGAPALGAITLAVVLMVAGLRRMLGIGVVHRAP